MNFFDPTSEDGDYVHLTPEERKELRKDMLLLAAIIICITLLTFSLC